MTRGEQVMVTCESPFVDACDPRTEPVRHVLVRNTPALIKLLDAGPNFIQLPWAVRFGRPLRRRLAQVLEALAHLCSPSRRLRKVDDSVRPVPAATLTQPELGHQARLVTVVSAPNTAAEQDEAAVSLPGPDHMACMPRKRCPIERDEHQTGLRAGDQQRCIVQAEPRPILPPRDVDNRKITSQSPASRDESVRCVFVSQ
jgi:hypothetical protein